MAADGTLTPSPTVAETLAALKSALTRAQAQLETGLVTNFNEGGVAETFLEAIAMALGTDASEISPGGVDGAYRLLQNAIDSCFAATAHGDALDAQGADVGVGRKGATAAQTLVRFFSDPPPAADQAILDGTIVSARALSPNGSPTTYITQSPIVYRAGTALSPPVVAIAAQKGSAGNVPRGAVDTVVSGAPGLEVTNPTAASGGFDKELDDGGPTGGYRGRVMEAIANSGQCQIDAIEFAVVRDFPAILSARLLENTDDDGLTRFLGKGQLFLDDGSGNLETNNPALLTQIQAALDLGKYRAAGTWVLVHGSVGIPVTLDFTINISQAYLSETGSTRDAVLESAALAAFQATNSTPMGRALTLATIAAAVREVPGVANVRLPSILINGLAEDLLPALNQTARCATIDAISVTDAGSDPLFG